MILPAVDGLAGAQDVIGKLHDLIGSTEERYAAMLAQLQKRVQDAECAAQDHEDQLQQQRAAASQLQNQLTAERLEKENLRRCVYRDLKSWRKNNRTS